ncbi:hypothetical protein E2562_035467 [Oryza meyeriana var. granulata]|uniref:DUF7794 domain-containing protein n=1 Tax=Oryza meyeriana var. granulata TaxID=110450 RepID=A0A6G1CL74_9ORYZ|nr:hypothetical protein E2562_035467 [Oryza meyeriana var. granulata]
MARRLPAILLLFSALLLALASASASAAAPQAQAAFVDAASRRYLRDQQQDQQATSMSLDEVSATVSVLLGFAPPASLPAQSSSKLNKALLPNPFDRPRAVFLLQIDGSHASVESITSEAGSIFKTTIEGLGNSAAGLTDKDDLVIVHSDESPAVDSGSDYFDSELTDLANWLGGSYEKVDGKLNIPLESGKILKLLVAKEADMEFASSLISLRRTIKRGILVHEDFSGGVMSPAELLVCHFTGIKALEDEYGSTEIVNQGTDVVQRAVAKAFDLLHGAYNGKIVGLVIATKEASPSLVGPTSSLHISRWLEETSQTYTTGSSEILVRKSLAWITGIILLVSTLIGVCLLMNMPFTRDTLLYSNVKID